MVKVHDGAWTLMMLDDLVTFDGDNGCKVDEDDDVCGEEMN